jgi:hypothetical protein
VHYDSRPKVPPHPHSQWSLCLAEGQCSAVQEEVKPKAKKAKKAKARAPVTPKKATPKKAAPKKAKKARTWSSDEADTDVSEEDEEVRLRHISPPHFQVRCRCDLALYREASRPPVERGEWFRCPGSTPRRKVTEKCGFSGEVPGRGAMELD